MPYRSYHSPILHSWYISVCISQWSKFNSVIWFISLNSNRCSRINDSLIHSLQGQVHIVLGLLSLPQRYPYLSLSLHPLLLSLSLIPSAYLPYISLCLPSTLPRQYLCSVIPSSSLYYPLFILYPPSIFTVYSVHPSTVYS